TLGYERGGHGASPTPAAAAPCSSPLLSLLPSEHQSRPAGPAPRCPRDPAGSPSAGRARPGARGAPPVRTRRRGASGILREAHPTSAVTAGGQDQTLTLVRPFRRRAARIARPALVRMRSRKPCVLARWRLFGWNVRLLTGGSTYGSSPAVRPRGAPAHGRPPGKAWVGSRYAHR